MVRRKAAQGARDRSETPPAEPGQRATKNAFDVFLDRGLHSMFDSIKDEPIPEELLRILQEDRKE